MDHIRGDHANHHTTGVIQMFVVSFLLKLSSEEPTSNNNQLYHVKSAPGHFGTYLNSQIDTY